MSEHLLSYNERQNCKLAMAWYERIDETVHSTRPVGETDYDEECLNSVNFYCERRTPCFSYGDIRRSETKFLLKG